MPILTLQSLSFAYEDRPLFQNVTLSLNQGERLALVGANGCGKTTLLRLITGELTPGGGLVVCGARLGYASQEAEEAPGEHDGKTLYEEALEVFRPLLDMEREMERLRERAITDHSPALLHRMDELRVAFERGGGLTCRARTRSALLGLGFPEEDHQKPAALLSGGQRVKLRLGRLLLSGAELLLLDEPTNHLDLLALRWLEEYLAAYQGAVILVSHDRYFLDRVATRTAALAHGRLLQFQGNYSAYLRQAETGQALVRRHYDNQLAEIKRIEAIIEQQRRFNQARNYVTIASKEKQLERLRAELVVPDGNLRELRFRFPPVAESGNEVLRMSSLAMAFGGKPLFQKVSGLVEKGERVFILGANGCGKTTLLNILRRRLRPEEGWFSWGANVRPGSYDQNQAIPASEKTVLDEVWDCYRTLTQTEIRSMLGMFLFSGDDVFKPVSALSGGERARVALLKLMLSGANVLLLDEPTNHLDIPSREALESALSAFGGTIIAVSHDRFFIQKLATRILALSPDGLAESDFEHSVRPSPQVLSSRPPKEPNEYQRKKEQAAQRRRNAAALVRCEGEIARLEAQTAAIQAELEANAADYAAVLRLTEELKQTETQLEECLNEWEILSAEGQEESIPPP
ncbi:MAG: ABC-F family ATP-binding cassette domain-containing protein [Oscillospiraceae bacterium]|jgi:ATP-binding cassette subfamily F protein 3|nr:ABC-F family ATP-binding cassette domain-containing protein [Oscillospiraceae bacterium]